MQKKNPSTVELLARLEKYKPLTLIGAGESVSHQAATEAFEALFSPAPTGVQLDDTYIYVNQYQLEQAMQLVANWFGFTTKSSGSDINCGCGKTHKQKLIDKKIKQQESMSFVEVGVVDNSRKRKRTSPSQIDCPFLVKISKITSMVPKGVKPTKINTPVKITFANFEHNHPLNKAMLIKAKRATGQYSISPEVCLALLKLTRAGPIPTITLRTYLQGQFPSTMKITATTICNIKMKCCKLEQTFNKPEDIPGSELKRVFDSSSLEMAPEHWYQNPNMEKIFDEAMMEQLAGPKHMGYTIQIPQQTSIDW